VTRASGAPDLPPYYFDMVDPEGPGRSPAMIVPLLIDDLVLGIGHTPDWRVDNPGASIVQLSVLAKGRNEARIGFAGAGVEGVIELGCEPSGWMRVVASVAGAEVFRAYLDQVWEEHELWPANAEKMQESPGRMGKKRNWLSLRADAWPALRPLANEGGWVNIMAMEYITIHVCMSRDGADAWRPFKAVPCDFAFELIAPEDGGDTDACVFQPGDRVRCKLLPFGGEDLVVAVARADALA
jgi:hypothetical protein